MSFYPDRLQSSNKRNYKVNRVVGIVCKEIDLHWNGMKSIMKIIPAIADMPICKEKKWCKILKLISGRNGNYVVGSLG